MIKEAHEALTLIKNSQINQGMHIFDHIPRDYERIEYIGAIFRADTENGLSLRSTIFEILDIDLEVHARYIPSILLILEQGNDMVTIDRVEKFIFGAYSIIRLITSRVYSKLSHLFLSIKHPDTESGFKFFNLTTMREVLEETEDDGWFWDTEIVYRAERASKKLTCIKGVFCQNPEKKSTVRVIPDSIAYLRAAYKFKKNLKKNNG